MKTLITSIALALLGAFSTMPAQAQKAEAGTKVAVISQELSLAKSKVGIYIADQLMALDKTIDKEFESELAPLRTQAQQLNTEIKALSPETLRTRTDLQRRGQEIRQKFAELGNWKQRQMAATREQALAPAYKAYEKAVNEVIKEKNIQILLPGEATLYRTSAVDITEAVVAKIDAVMTTTPVNRVRVPRKPTQQELQQAQARAQQRR
ncbi:MAG: OmpH family outer membrane protein [Robiginitomaculum sp.]|nr:OmpH family outer membrane protein [Robiginitomaculum sp.]MDQ7078477.1 OmpH family outer membrane protein [Robiginitomaculum sp.]